jgi:hypothetical protein
MLPRQLLAVREIGDTQVPYWSAATADGVQLLLEPDEELLFVGYCRVRQNTQKSWTLDRPTTLVITSRRTAFLTTQFDKGGGWVGFGAAGLAVAATANAVSKQRANKRSAGKVAIGHVRHEWVTEISLRRRKALIGAVDTYLDLTVATASGPRVIELWATNVITEDLARWFTGTMALHRLKLLSAAPPELAERLEVYKTGRGEMTTPDRPDQLTWVFPGKADELIAAVIASIPAGTATEGASQPV